MSDLSDREQTNVRTALKFLHARCGRWDVTGKALQFNGEALCGIASGRKPVSARLVIRIAKLAKVGVDDVLTGRFPAPGTCPHCGHCPDRP